MPAPARYPAPRRHRVSGLSPKKLGVVGLGRMGGPVAQRLMQSEFPVMVWDTVPACRKPFENRENIRIATPGEMARECAVLFFVVPSSQEIANCLKGKDGVLQHARKGLVICDLTTSDPVETRKIARRAALRDIDYIDAGMSGGPAGILAGKLTLMIGGDARVLSRIGRYRSLYWLWRRHFWLTDSWRPLRAGNPR